ncbi:FG-GAP repeat domain-containing protein [Lysobacter sp. cf310]|uniref:FG-GAP repeat domain-containing protein n=1 Tax=Lysobacter sp. cf310 TaxID=1761790 RepID=UPI000B8720EA|nr:VCBS repeat-containing protein [Lysobacter sp. cf310]
MRNFISAAIAAALLTGCPLEQGEVGAESNSGGIAAKNIPNAIAATGRMQATATARAPNSARGGMVKAVAFGPSDALEMSAAQAATPFAAATRPAKDDANADGRSDITWFRVRGADSEVAHWRMNGATVLQTTGPTLVKPGSGPAGNGDFDGDRRVDQLWFNLSEDNRQLTLARQNETGGFEQTYIAAIGAGWAPNAIEDINGDGKSDIVWVDRARGLIAYWLMNGASVLDSRLYTVDTNNYDFLGTGDFDGDGRGDLLWLGRSTRGPLYMWRGRPDGHFDQLLVGDLSIAFQFDSATDLNGDGRSDLIFTSYSGRSFSYWLMNGAAVQQRGSIPIDRDNYAIAATGDFDGDGKGDVMWTTKAREATASLYLWRGRGDGTFDSQFVAYYDHTTWMTLQNR